LENVDSDHIPCLSHVIFDVFPGHLIAQIREEQPTTFHLAAVLFNVFLAVELAADVLAASLVFGIGGLPIFASISLRSCSPGFFIPCLLLIAGVGLIHNHFKLV